MYPVQGKQSAPGLFHFENDLGKKQRKMLECSKEKWFYMAYFPPKWVSRVKYTSNVNLKINMFLNWTHLFKMNSQCLIQTQE